MSFCICYSLCNSAFQTDKYFLKKEISLYFKSSCISNPLALMRRTCRILTTLFKADNVEFVGCEATELRASAQGFLLDVRVLWLKPSTCFVWRLPSILKTGDPQVLCVCPVLYLVLTVRHIDSNWRLSMHAMALLHPALVTCYTRGVREHGR